MQTTQTTQGTQAAQGGPWVASDSTMWQSPSWLSAVSTVYRFEPSWRVINAPWLIALRLLWQRRRHEAVLTTGNQVTLYYGVLCRLLGLEPRQVVAQLYLNERAPWIDRVHDRLMRAVLARAHGVIVTSRGELPFVRDRFGVPEERIRFVAGHTNVIEPVEHPGEGGVVLAAGRNFRDYATLVEAIRLIDVPLTIVCGEDQLRDVPVPAHVTVRREIPWEEYMALTRAASFVVVPLSTGVIPAGQVAILEAMAYGKPVITARAVGTVDYVGDGAEGLLYEPGDPADLARQIERLHGDASLRRALGRAAFRRVLDEFTFDRHVQAKLAAISELASLPARAS